MLLYDNAFSPFARKVRLVLDHKSVSCEIVDGLALANRDALAKVNGRVEVPTLVDGGVVVVGSSDIVAYLERIHPAAPVYPNDNAAWVRARAWERCADSTIDPILIDLSYWTWAERTDERPQEWVVAAQADLAIVYNALERDLDGHDFVCGDLSIADIALFPHLVSTKALGVGHDPSRYPRLHAWFKRVRQMPIFAADIERTKAFLTSFGHGKESDHDRNRIFWRGDRIEWLLTHGFHDWLFREIEANRVLWPGLGVPG
jgi:glutathione S-transferase